MLTTVDQDPEPNLRSPIPAPVFPGTPSEFITVMAHYHRAEIARIAGWRDRIDRTTNWAITAVAAMLSLSLSTPTGQWHYREHDWVATTGAYVFEPPGEIHTLVVPEDTEEMITFFNITGCMLYLDEANRYTGYEDVFTKIDMCQRHYTACGLGAD